MRAGLKFDKNELRLRVEIGISKVKVAQNYIV